MRYPAGLRAELDDIEAALARVEGKPFCADEAARLKDRHEKLKRLWAENGQKPLIQEMSRIVERLLRHYHSDFYLHDISYLVANPEAVCVWVLRGTGTDLLPLNPPLREEPWYRAIYDARRWGGGILKTYIVQMSAGVLRETDPDKVRFAPRDAA